jgi:hypothetical protein
MGYWGIGGIVFVSLVGGVGAIAPVMAQSTPEENLSPAERLNLSPDILDHSPTLQRWLEEVPDLSEDIRHDPSFRTRLRLGYARFHHADADGVFVGIEDVFLGESSLTVSGEYARSGEGDRTSYGADLRAYVLPLGNYVNVAPSLGYQHLDIGDETIEGFTIGARLMVALSRTGAADFSLSQEWVRPGSDQEVSVTTFSLGYAVSDRLRLTTDLQRERSPLDAENRVGVGLEWLF